MTNTREQIVACADELFYRRGFAATSFADIAAAVKISRGNFYHHFKTKDDILSAVIERRLQVRHDLMSQWEVDFAAPIDRIRCFIRILIQNQAKIRLYGCPLGTLSSELHKLGHPAQGAARELFVLFCEWLALQFQKAGKRPAQARHAAQHLLARSQGVATLHQVYQDAALLKREVKLLEEWLTRELAATS